MSKDEGMPVVDLIADSFIDSFKQTYGRAPDHFVVQTYVAGYYAGKRDEAVAREIKGIRTYLAQPAPAASEKCETCGGFGGWGWNEGGKNEKDCDDCHGTGTRAHQPQPVASRDAEMTALREAVKVCAERLDIFRRTKDETHLDTCVRYLNGAQESTRNALRAASAAPLGYWRDEADKEDERAEAMQPVAADAEASEDYPERLRLMAYGLSQYIVSRNPEHPEYVRADACDTSILTGLEAMDTNVRKSMRIAELESQCAQLTRRIEEARKSWQWHQDRADGQEKRAREAESDRDRLAAEVARLEAENERLQPLKNGAWAKHMLLNQVLDEMRGDPELKAFAEKERDRIENEMLIPPPPTDKQPAPTTPTAEQSVDALVEECSNQAAAIDRRGGAHKIAHCFAPLAQRLTQAERKCAFEIGRFKYLQEITDSIAAHQRGVIETSRDRIANLQAKLAEAQKERDDLARKLNAVKEAAG